MPGIVNNSVIIFSAIDKNDNDILEIVENIYVKIQPDGIKTIVVNDEYLTCEMKTWQIYEE